MDATIVVLYAGYRYIYTYLHIYIYLYLYFALIISLVTGSAVFFSSSYFAFIIDYVDYSLIPIDCLYLYMFTDFVVFFSDYYYAFILDYVDLYSHNTLL